MDNGGQSVSIRVPPEDPRRASEFHNHVRHLAASKLQVAGLVFSYTSLRIVNTDTGNYVDIYVSQ
jgi:hypothetical protein